MEEAKPGTKGQKLTWGDGYIRMLNAFVDPKSDFAAVVSRPGIAEIL